MMKTTIKGLFTFALATCAGMCISSCSAEKDYYDPSAVEAQKKAEYAANFVSKYGTFSADQTWDFSNNGEAMYTLVGESRATRSAGDYTLNIGDWYEVDTNLTKWMKKNLAEGRDNRSKGHSFYMTVPESGELSFIPIYQGNATMVWDLYIAVGAGNDPKIQKVWSKNENLAIKDVVRNHFPEWTNLGSNGAGHTMDSEYDIRGKKYTISGLPAGEPVYFYLEITTDDHNYAYRGSKQSSLAGHMLAMEYKDENGNYITPNGLEGYNTMVMGCEDGNLPGSDWDLNDVVFLIYGNPLPQIIETQPNQVVSETGKRYMVEDLGSTDDFDFNDVVFDVISKKTLITTTLGPDSEKQHETIEQNVYVRALGGTLDVKIEIGNWGWLKSQAGYNPAEMINTNGITVEKFNYSPAKVPGWKEDNSTVKVTVYKEGEKASVNGTVADNTNGTIITFPKAGEVPMIIAVPLSQNWMKERQSIPKNWFTIPAE